MKRNFENKNCFVIYFFLQKDYRKLIEKKMNKI